MPTHWRKEPCSTHVTTARKNIQPQKDTLPELEPNRASTGSHQKISSTNSRTSIRRDTCTNREQGASRAEIHTQPAQIMTQLKARTAASQILPRTTGQMGTKVYRIATNNTEKVKATTKTNTDNKRRVTIVNGTNKACTT